MSPDGAPTERPPRSSGQPHAPSSCPRPSDAHGERQPAIPQVAFDHQPVEHIEALIEDDKRLFQRLRPDLETFKEELEQIEEACLQEERETASKRAECDRLAGERRHLEQQLEALQRQLRGLRAERQECRSAGALGRSDCERHGREAVLLRRVVDEMARDLAQLEKSVAYLERSNPEVVSHARSLGEKKREISDQVRKESQLLRAEQMQGERAKEALEALQRGGAAVQLWGSSAEPAFVSTSADTAGGEASAVQRPRADKDRSQGGAAPWYQGVSLGLSAPQPGAASATPARSRPGTSSAQGRAPPMELREGV